MSTELDASQEDYVGGLDDSVIRVDPNTKVANLSRRGSSRSASSVQYRGEKCGISENGERDKCAEGLTLHRGREEKAQG